MIPMITDYPYIFSLAYALIVFTLGVCLGYSLSSLRIQRLKNRVAFLELIGPRRKAAQP